ncbi:CHAD domain-containing protein [Streptomyces sp. ME19-01-6]|uniref:CHAD domain-containing protein n=1 Tax=Streptomyces sp. ME19-01-6 TaxID=3028686 RepID=UPI0029B39B96|nr:CHAD domain-containing protein [Streptomyces sp. ME19-01-6]MDX3227191.1 CHAD domain-containing protein [Streptomyces sp. ME19-01-6]
MTDGVMGVDAAAAGPALATATAGDVLSWYLNTQAGDFLRSLRQQRESGADAEEAAEAARLLRRCARRISGTLWVYRPLTDTAWADQLRSELRWLSGTLALEHAYAARLTRLRGALHRLSGAGAPADAAAGARGAAAADVRVDARVDARGDGAAGDAAAQRSPRAARRSVSLTADAPQDPPGPPGPPGPRGSGTAGGGAADAAHGAARDTANGASGDAAPGPEAGAAGQRGDRAKQQPGGGAGPRPGGGADEARGGALTVGAARAGALLERQLTLARTRAHTAALQVLGSSRFHAVADAVALLASEVPLDEAAAPRPAGLSLPPLAGLAHRRLVEAVETLPLGRAGHPYNAEALVHGLAATPAADAPPASERQDAPWDQVRRLVRLRRYALEVLDAGQRPDGTGPVDADPSLSVRLLAAGQALERHRDAAEAAAAAATAARTPRIAPATAYALGVLHADQRHEVEAARFAFGRIWQRIAVSAHG